MLPTPLLPLQRSIMDSRRSPFHRQPPQGLEVSRRTVMRTATMTALTGAVLGQGAVRALPARAAASLPLLTTPQSPLALPILGDSVNMDQPKYYDTLQAGSRRANRTRQSADLDGDGSDEMVLRGPGGILAYRFDTASGQWWDLLGDSPTWSDLQGWGEAQYYETIQTADLDGDPVDEVCGLAFMSDAAPSRAARSPHPDFTGTNIDRKRFQGASLDHSMWFHRPGDPGEWHWFDTRSHGLSGGRGLVTGDVVTQSGRQVATIAQQVLLRKHRSVG